MRNKSRKIIILYMTLSLMTSMFLPYLSSAAQPSSQVIGDVWYDASKAIATEGSNQTQDLAYYFSNAELDYGTQNVTVPAGKNLSRVVLREKYTKKELRDLPLKSTSSYELKVQGEENEVTAKQDSYLGYFEWFRAPQRKQLWMYDYDGTRYFHWNQGIYDIPQSNAKISSLQFNGANPPATPSTSELQNGRPSNEGHIAWDLRNIPIDINTMKFSDLTKNQNLDFELDKVDDLRADVSFIESAKDGSLRKSDILETPDDRKHYDLQQRIFTFSYKAQFVIPPENPPIEDSNGRVIRYYNQWRVIYKAKVYKYTPMELVAYFDDGGSPPVTPGDPKCVPTIQPPTKGTVNTTEAMDPKSHAVLRADNRGGELFDVGLGIPTSENLFANAFGLSYLFQHKFSNMTGVVSYQVEVTKNYVWVIPGAGKDAPPIPMQQRVTQTMTVKRPYSYWQIDNLEVYKLQKSTISNYALGGYGGTVQLDPNGYTAPTLQSDNKDDVNQHVQPAGCKGVDLGTAGGPPPGGTPSEFQSAAESAVGRNQVNNDKVVFNGQTVMENAKHPDQAPPPGKIPEPKEIEPNVLYKNALTVSNSLVNRANQPTTGRIFYQLTPGNIKGGADKFYDIAGINPVTVHTPVVMYPSVSDDQEHNQKVEPNPNRAALILDRPFVVTLPTTGQHNAYPGFGGYGVTNGYGEYAKYTANKQVQFEFDVWNASKSQYIEAGTWIDIPVNQLQTTFIMPTWVDEGNYTVYFRSVAINAPAGFSWQTGANFNWPNHVATNTIPVEVIGRLYDFRITDIGDYDWQSVFRAGKNTSSHSKNVYWVGSKDIDGNTVGNRDMSGAQVNNDIPLKLPIRPGSHPNPGYKNVAVKTGYNFKFDLKSKGNMFGQKDGIRITPTFYFVKKDGTGRTPVDLYYHDYTNKKYFVKIGSADDVASRYVILNDPMRNVPSTELTDTSNWVASNYGITDFLKRANQKTTVGKYSWEILPWQTRTFIGPKTIPSGVNDQRALAAIQHWYGEYSIPAAAYVVKAGTNIQEYGRKNGGLDDKSPIFLKDGYIIVNFNIESIKNADTARPFLRYYRLPGDTVPLANQWLMEGFYNNPKAVADKYGNNYQLMDGDVVFYHGDLSSNDDLGSSVTH
ncbi:DUF5704 domain-containing protein [Paenibacillus chitinolyticus]|uniref:DUF5704 domain-containing protein n=1 Tax=Paenibacillus chitinolyticus TaxID=79263 RepID=UPI00210A3679|nr:DUF5704 domain-containing protein [Paenibacillus chitinolyticus]